MRRKYIAIALAALTLSGCAGVSQKVDSNVDQTDSKAEMLIKDVGHAAPAGVVGNVTPSVVHENGIWLGKSVVKLGQPSLPPIFYEPATFDRTVSSLSEVPTVIGSGTDPPAATVIELFEIVSGAGTSVTAAVATLLAVAPVPSLSLYVATTRSWCPSLVSATL